MKSNNELKESDIKNCRCHYFDDVIRIVGINIDNIFLGEKLHKNSYENILIYDILYKTFMDEKPLRIRFGKLDGFIKIYYGTRYLVLFGPGWYDAIYNRIGYLISEKGGITNSITYNFAKIRIYLYNSLPIEKILTFHNVVIVIKSLVNRNKIITTIIYF